MSGGYYKYRCKYFFTHNCPYWVWVHNAPCAHCLADGRDSEVATEPSPFRLSREVCVPKLESDILHCIITEVISNGDTDSGWTVKYPPIQHFPTATGPSVAIGTTATDEPDGQKGSKTGLGPQRVGTGWAT